MEYNNCNHNSLIQRPESSGLSFMYGGILWLIAKAQLKKHTNLQSLLPKVWAFPSGMSYLKRKAHPRIFIDKDDGINIDDCEAFSRPFNKILDEKDFIDQSYIFEVGSPGVARELKRPEHFEKYIGSPVRVRLIRAADGLKEIIGLLKEYNKDSILVDEKEIKLSDTAFVKLYDDENIFDE